MRRVLLAVACLMGVLAQVAPAQIWDRSGNGLLSGSYVFRNVIYLPADPAGNIGGAAAGYGTINFDGRGNYTVSAFFFDSSNRSGNYTDSGTYSLAANGYGFMTHPVANGNIQIMLANGVLMGSSTDSQLNDFLFAVQANPATNATFNGSYSLAYLSVASSYTGTYDTLATLNPNGNGNIGSVPVKSYLGVQAAPINQTENSVSYTFSSGVGTLRFPSSPTNIPLIGNMRMYISADGNFMFGGADNDFDIFVGVRRGGGTPPAMSGLYYSVGMNHNAGGFDSYGGSFFAYDRQGAGPGLLWDHQRFLGTYSGPVPINFTGAAEYPSTPVAEYTDDPSDVEYVISQNATFRIGIGQSPFLGLRVGVKIPDIPNPGGSGPWIKPTGVQNSASSAPFTAGISPGELITIYGENLATTPVIMQGGIPFPTTLGGVQVLMNNRPAPLYYAYPGQVAAIVPYGLTDSIIQIQVVRDNVTSNAVTAFNYQTGPGLFSESTQGQGLAKILHADYRQVTPDNPAVPGEDLMVFLTGLGAVFPSIQDGGLGQVSDTVLNIRANVDNLPADVTYKGLAPGLAGLYQLNLKVPGGVGNGDAFVDIATPDAYTSQATIPIIGGVVPREARGHVHRR